MNSPSSQGAIGDIYNTNTPSLTLGCGSYGKNSVSQNVTTVNLINKKRIAKRRVNMQWFKVPPKIYFEEGSIQYLEKIQALEKQGIRVKVSDISAAMSLPRPGVTRTVKEMEKKGYLTKKPSEEDARIMYLFITDEGKKLSTKYNEQVFNALLPDLETISGEDAECTIRTIERFYQVMCERRNDLDK